MDRQRILIIFGAAWLSAALLTWFLWSRTKAPQAEKTARIAAAVRDLPAGAKLSLRDIKFVNLPAKDLPRAAVTDPRSVDGFALLYPVTANEPLTTLKLASTRGPEGLPATIEKGFRAVSIPVSDSSGAAGLVQPRSHVDVLFTRAGSMAEALTATVLEDVVVLSIGRNTEAASAQPAPSGAAPNVNATRAVTLLVTPEDARKLELARHQGRLSLALRNPLDRSRLQSKEAVTAEALDPQLFTRIRRPTPVGGSPAAIRDPEAWATLTAQPSAKQPRKEPKPRVVIDVFRGDKHLQESFQ